MTWYDLPEDGHETYLSWLHETYIPGLLQRAGFLWAAHYASVEKEKRPTTIREKRLSRTDDSAQ